jgi:predicted DNA-binding transcriptional regulator YafY
MTMSTRLARLDRLEAWLKNEDALALGDAATEFGVSLRTLHRDLEILRERGVPVESERGRGGGVRIAPGWGIGRINLSRREALDLLIGLAIGESLYASLQMSHAEAIRRKVMGSFAPGEQRRIAAMRKRIRIGGAASGAVLASLEETRKQCGHALKEAFALNRVISMRYRDRHRNHTERLIEPHFLLLNPPVWYALCWDELRGDIRAFRCDRITDAFVTDTIFKPRPWEDFARMLEGHPTREA